MMTQRDLTFVKTGTLMSNARRHGRTQFRRDGCAEAYGGALTWRRSIRSVIVGSVNVP
jgi:hypothetical protein